MTFSPRFVSACHGALHGDSDQIAVEGHVGTWYAIDETEVGGEKFFLLEHEEYGDETACVAVNEQGKLVAEDLWNGFDEDFQDAVKEYFAEKNPTSQKEEQVVPVEEESARMIRMSRSITNLSAMQQRMAKWICTAFPDSSMKSAETPLKKRLQTTSTE